MVKVVIERILSIISIVGLIVGTRNKKKGWMVASLVSSCVRLGMGLSYFIDFIEEEN